MTEPIKGKPVYEDPDFDMHIVDPREHPEDLRIVFTDLFHRETLRIIHDADRAALFRDMNTKDQVCCVQSGILGALCLYLSASTPTKQVQAMLKATLLKAIPVVMDAAERHVEEIRRNNNLPPKPEE